MKQINKKEWELASTAAIVDYIVKNGFENISILKNELDGKPYKIEENKIYISNDEENSEKFQLINSEDVLKFAEILGDFHCKAEGFIQPPGIKVKALWGKSLDKYRTMTAKLEKYGRLLERGGRLNRFEEKTWNHIEGLAKSSRNCMKVFRSLYYLRALESSMIRKEICLNSICDKTAVTSQNKIIITGIFDLGYNMVEEDVGKLVRKSIERTGNKLLFEEIIKAYSNSRELGENSETIIKALVAFPYGSIKVINNYMSKKENGDVLIEKFNRYLEKDQNTDILGG